jgi:hypothetical protein
MWSEYQVNICELPLHFIDVDESNGVCCDISDCHVLVQWLHQLLQQSRDYISTHPTEHFERRIKGRGATHKP